MTDEKDITLPSGKIVTIRSYTTHADDTQAEAALYSGVTADKEGDINFPIANVMASTDVYVRRLVKSIDGETKNIQSLLDNLRSEEYSMIKDAVDEVTSVQSPKA